MFKTIILQTLIYMTLNVVCFIVGAIFNKFLTLDQATIITLILLILNFIWLIIRVCKRKNNLTHQETLSKKITKPSKVIKNKPTPINKEIIIEYSDTEGEITTRQIRVKEIKYDKQKKKMVPYSLYAYCFLKKAPRTFVINRIISAYDAETGEIITDIAHYCIN